MASSPRSSNPEANSNSGGSGKGGNPLSGGANPVASSGGAGNAANSKPKPTTTTTTPTTTPTSSSIPPSNVANRGGGALPPSSNPSPNAPGAPSNRGGSSRGGGISAPVRGGGIPMGRGRGGGGSTQRGGGMTRGVAVPPTGTSNRPMTTWTAPSVPPSSGVAANVSSGPGGNAPSSTMGTTSSTPISPTPRTPNGAGGGGSKSKSSGSSGRRRTFSNEPPPSPSFANPGIQQQPPPPPPQQQQQQQQQYQQPRRGVNNQPIPASSAFSLLSSTSTSSTTSTATPTQNVPGIIRVSALGNPLPSKPPPPTIRRNSSAGSGPSTPSSPSMTGPGVGGGASTKKSLAGAPENSTTTSIDHSAPPSRMAPFDPIANTATRTLNSTHVTPPHALTSARHAPPPVSTMVQQHHHQYQPPSRQEPPHHHQQQQQQLPRVTPVPPLPKWGPSPSPPVHPAPQIAVIPSNSTWGDEMANAANSTSSSSTSSSANEEIIERLRSQLDRFKLDHAAATKELTVLRRDFAKAKEDLERTTAQLAKKTTEYTTLDVAFRSFGSIRTRLEEERDNARAAALRAEREVSNLKAASGGSSSAEAEATIAELTKALKDSEMKINALQVDAELAVAEIEYEKVIGENLRAELAEKDARIAALEEQLLRASTGAQGGGSPTASGGDHHQHEEEDHHHEYSDVAPTRSSAEERGEVEGSAIPGDNHDDDDAFDENDWVFACEMGRLEGAVDKLGFSRLEMFTLDASGWTEESGENQEDEELETTVARSVVRSLTGIANATRDEARSALISNIQPESQVLLAVVGADPKYYATSDRLRAAAASLVELVGEAYEAAGASARVAILLEGGRKSQWSLDQTRIVNI